MRYKGDTEYSKVNGIINYKANLEARRGHNYAYYTDELHNDLMQKGYTIYNFGIGNNLIFTQQNK